MYTINPYKVFAFEKRTSDCSKNSCMNRNRILRQTRYIMYVRIVHNELLLRASLCEFTLFPVLVETYKYMFLWNLHYFNISRCLKDSVPVRGKRNVLSVFPFLSRVSFPFRSIFVCQTQRRPVVIGGSVSWNRRYIKFRADCKASGSSSEWRKRTDESGKAGETRDGRSFDNLGHAASRSGTDGIITVMLLKLRFFDPPRRPAAVTLSSLINELRTKS